MDEIKELEVVCKTCKWNKSIETCKSKVKDHKFIRSKFFPPETYYGNMVYCPYYAK